MRSASVARINSMLFNRIEIVANSQCLVEQPIESRLSTGMCEMYKTFVRAHECQLNSIFSSKFLILKTWLFALFY